MSASVRFFRSISILFFFSLSISGVISFKRTTKFQLNIHVPLRNSVDVYFGGCYNCQYDWSPDLIAMMVASLNHFGDKVDAIAILNHFRMKKCDSNCQWAHKFRFLLGLALLLIFFIGFVVLRGHRNFSDWLLYTPLLGLRAKMRKRAVHGITNQSVWHTVLSRILLFFLSHTYVIRYSVANCAALKCARISMRASELNN